MQPRVRVRIGLDGVVHVEVISILEDLRDDYRWFLSGATKTDAEQDPLAFKRECRASLLTFFAFAEGCIDLILLLLGLANEVNAPRNFFGKIALIEGAVGSQIPGHQLEQLRNLRNQIEHLWPGRDMQIFDRLSLGDLQNLDTVFQQWVRLLPLECHVVLDYDSRDVHAEICEAVSKQGVELDVIRESQHP